METKRIVIGTFVCVGAKEYTAWEVPVDMTEQELEDLAWESAYNYAESYGVYNPGDEYQEDEWECEGDYERALHEWEQGEGWWEVYDSDKHDGHLLYGYTREIEWNKP